MHCEDCTWSGSPYELVSGTDEFEDREFIFCPQCGSKNVAEDDDDCDNESADEVDDDLDGVDDFAEDEEEEPE